MKRDCVVRLKTSSYKDSKGGLVSTRCLHTLKRRTTFDLLEQELSDCGANHVFSSIININECEDGVYKLVVCDKEPNYETGYLEDWKLQLIRCEE